jgi:DNA-binding protein HU-beta
MTLTASSYSLTRLRAPIAKSNSSTTQGPSAMNHAELVEKVAGATNMPKATASGAVEAVVQAIIDAAKAGDEVRVAGLGIFDVVAREARPGRNPQTGESIDIPASKALRFRAGKLVKDQLNATRQGTPKKAAV